MSDQITPQTLLQAYAAGIFPMSETADDPEIFWVDPEMRGVFPLDGFHVSRSLKRVINRGDYQIRFNTSFADVVSACADRPETWINKPIFDLYLLLHELGFAHSQEIYKDNRLIGGVYGVTLGTAFFGESMFSCETNGSKLALFHLMERLNAAGFTLFDTQFITPHLSSLGAIEISRQDYHHELTNALKMKADINLVD